MKRQFQAKGTAAMTAAVLLAAVAARAGEPIHEEVSAAKNGTVSVENLAGSVVVTGWDQAKVLVEGTLGDGAERVDVEADDGDVTIEVVLPRHARNVEDTDLVIRVPKGSRVEIETVSADVEIGGVRGDVDVSTVSGEVEAREIGAADVETVSGEIDVAKSGGPVEASSVSGRVRVSDCGEWLEVSTTSGDIDLRDKLPARVECETTSGMIEANFEPAADGSYRFEGFSGDVVLRMPEAIDAAIDIETHSGRIRSEWDGRVREERYGPGASLSVREGDASADIVVNTFSGDVRLDKR